jgi:hypothetical protein
MLLGAGWEQRRSDTPVKKHFFLFFFFQIAEFSPKREIEKSKMKRFWKVLIAINHLQNKTPHLYIWFSVCNQ